ncbi:hypothetical protein K466DRAFT_204610 [Polyporus arcularius HHB13444]|uniref:Uncharacterized protein n=1 Tax=Polyporus arcularius HHB13444 TaxID=1314778 RepID=A0A5C3P6U7_9APHY|nr:hypothetical protein K466DRAFT_204610 [Polyporus arcularius HHB13444]
MSSATSAALLPLALALASPALGRICFTHIWLGCLFVILYLYRIAVLSGGNVLKPPTNAVPDIAVIRSLEYTYLVDCASGHRWCRRTRRRRAGRCNMSRRRPPTTSTPSRALGTDHVTTSSTRRAHEPSSVGLEPP